MAYKSRKYYPALGNRITQMLDAGEWTAFPVYFQSLSVAHFRAAGPVLAEMMAEKLDENGYWSLASVMVSYNSRAFLVTMLKTAVLSGVPACGNEFEQFCRGLQTNAIDVEKTLQCLFPVFSTPQDMERLLALLGMDDVKQRVRHLIRQDTDAAAYVLFHTLKFVEHDRDFLIRTVKFLIQKQNERSYNFASLLTSYFGLVEVRAVFSLKIEPYQLAWLEGSYEAFRKVLNR